eukprot:CAMPEP_0173309470 /NCGR_PEP_ID=MMETSP1143-20121109/22348_1 /TAXON_ID=483371 /ORGANISM="non described non described, Strain CCMP2298" /LENGTH=59 /DNA_ID=CAMNT_0014251065 /DNA_START=366 /DNA_END=541 /DNA_ORIENTATION=+
MALHLTSPPGLALVLEGTDRVASATARPEGIRRIGSSSHCALAEGGTRQDRGPARTSPL